MITVPSHFFHQYPLAARQALGRISSSRNTTFHIAGGSVRDWLLGRRSGDLDITVPAGPFQCAEDFSRMTGGTLVVLNEEEGVARVVGEQIVDFTGFRRNASTIEEDLLLRDFTLNAMAVVMPGESHDRNAGLPVIDPLGGAQDLASGRIRMASERIFEDDPLRIVRAYRFQALFGFSLERETELLIEMSRHLAAKPAVERIHHEMALIMASPRSHQALAAMAASGVLQELYPELASGMGVAQPSSHHLDVFFHNLATLHAMERLLERPESFFPNHGDALREYLQDPKRRARLKWAALLHDVGKPATEEVVNGKIHFYGHDAAGRKVFDAISRRYKWGRDDSREVSRLIVNHMRPFHLCNAVKKHGLTPRACLRAWKEMGDELPGLFLLSMADSLAGQGKEKPPDMERRIADLYDGVDRTCRERIRPVLERERLLTGHDLIQEFHLAPGPLFRRILDGVEQARVSGHVTNRDDAVAWVKAFLVKKRIKENRGFSER